MNETTTSDPLNAGVLTDLTDEEIQTVHTVLDVFGGLVERVEQRPAEGLRMCDSLAT